VSADNTANQKSKRLFQKKGPSHPDLELPILALNQSPLLLGSPKGIQQAFY
jgi:hypothetical protein